jgi:hypothetical protein
VIIKGYCRVLGDLAMPLFLNHEESEQLLWILSMLYDLVVYSDGVSGRVSRPLGC